MWTSCSLACLERIRRVSAGARWEAGVEKLLAR
jgi:hypothetical protein